MIIKGDALIDYEDRTSYKVKLQVTDNKDAMGRADDSIDDTTTLTIRVTDVANDRPHQSQTPKFESPGTDCVWKPGEKVTITLTFNEAVTVTGTPSVGFDYGYRNRKSATYESGTGTRELKFTYTVPAGELTTHWLIVLGDTLALNGGTIKSTADSTRSVDLHNHLGPRSVAYSAGNSQPKSVRCAPWPDTSKPNPTISSVAVGGAWGPETSKAGTWSTAGSGGSRAVDVWVTFSEAVDVFRGDRPIWALPSETVTRPTVQIKTELGGTKTATWEFTVPSKRLLFRYRPTADDGFIEDVEVVANSLNLKGVKIRSVASGQPAVITHSGTGSVTTQSLLVGNDDAEVFARFVGEDTDPVSWAQGFTTGNSAMTLGGVRLQGRFTDDLKVHIFSSTSGTVGTNTETIPDTSLAVLENPGVLTWYHWLNVGGSATTSAPPAACNWRPAPPTSWSSRNSPQKRRRHKPWRPHPMQGVGSRPGCRAGPLRTEAWLGPAQEPGASLGLVP